MQTQNFKLASAQSEIGWIGRKVTGAHNGTIDILEGSLEFTNEVLTGGKFIIDTTSISILDIADPQTNAQFAGHLASEDFFSSAKYPTADFVIVSAERKSINNYKITGNLTIKGITNSVSFDAEVNLNDQTLQASGKMLLDRTLYDMKFRSGNFFQNLGDTLIYNDIDLKIKLTAYAEPISAAA